MHTPTVIQTPINSILRFPTARVGLKRSERRILLFLGDILVIVLAAFLAVQTWTVMRVDITMNSNFIFSLSNLLITLAILWIGLLVFADGYEPKVTVNIRMMIQRLIAVFFAFCIIYLIFFFLFAQQPANRYELPFIGQIPILRVVPITFAISTLLLQLIWRFIYARLLTSDQFRRRLLIIGAGRSGSTLLEAFQSVPDSHTYQIVGFIDDDPHKKYSTLSGIPILSNYLGLIREAIEHKVDEIVIAVSQDLSGGIFQAVMDCYERGIQITPMPVMYEMLTGRVPVEHIGKHWYVSLPLSAEPPGKLFCAIERTVDIVISLFGLVCVLLLCPFVMIGNLFGSCGPLFYSQTRIGRAGKVFKILKFRTMVPNAESKSGAVWAQQADPRVTPFGNFLRKSRLDELPQFWNILKGDMSLIGPRPERPEFVEQLAQQIPFYTSRHAVKPGLTGWAQVKYPYGASVEDSLMKLQYDLYYIKHRSLYLNYLILLKTIGVVIGLKGR